MGKKMVDKEYTHAIVYGNDDGVNISYFNIKEHDNDLNKVMEEYGVKEWILEFDESANYWQEGQAMLLEIKPILPKPIESVVKWGI